MDDWRRLLFEATRAPAPKGAPRSATTPPVPVPAHAPRVRPADAELHEPTIATPRAAAVALASEPPRPQPPAEPLLESTRRFLRPRVGIDPDSVPIVRGPAADRMAAETGAEAAAVGETVLLPSVHDERAPHTLGLIAHELTHVAQRRAPRFVPPAVRARFADDAPARAERASPIPTAEEALARHVERAVRNDATPALGDRSRDSQRARELAARSEAGPVAPELADLNTMSARDASMWGSLPAPWEPISFDDATSSGVGQGMRADPVTMLSRAASSSVAAPAADTAPVHFAEPGRESSSTEAAHKSSEPAPAPSSPAPDLDALARRVYDVLKRRLAAERRREG